MIGQTLTHHETIRDHVVNFYQTLFASECIGVEFEALLGDFSVRTLNSINASLLNRPFQASEIVEALRDMHPTKSPRTNEFHTFFYKQYWGIDGLDIMD